MFSKTSVFPKMADPQPARGQRTGTVVASGPTSSLTSASSDANSLREPVSNSTASPSPPPASPSAQPSGADEQNAGSRLIVGPDVKLKGAEILDCDTLVVEGRVEATMDSRVIRIAENGSFAGTVGIDVAEVRGRFDGELTARSQLIIHATGRVSGKIRYGKILIEEGGELSGDVQSLSSSKEPSRTGSREEPPKISPVAAAG
ncbi:bactofilin family protein [Aromatoleum sp.]|uniref:bactofilin family protein n=1 Tax=Aromatoleum sp. TaxID=2307007 RepID=UPI002FC879C2